MESLARPLHRRKHSRAMNASSSSFSLKNPYEDVFLSRGGKVKFEPHEYAEIFSGSSSIPVLDIPGLNEPLRPGGCRSSELDYSNIFGGANGDDDVAVPYENLFKKTKTRVDAEFEERGSLNSSGKAKQSSAANGHSSDGIKKQFNMSFNKSNQRSSDESNGEMHVTQLHAVPAFTHFVDGTPQLQKKEGDIPVSVPSVKRDVSRTWSFSSGLEAITVKDELNSEVSHAPDKSCNVDEINIKSHIPPLGRQPGLNDNQDGKQSRLPNSGSKETVGQNLPSLSDEELEENSDAAVSVAALKKAIEQAHESIRLAKMIMQKRREGVKGVFRVRRSKGRSKFEEKKENRSQHVPDGLKENNTSVESRQLDSTFPMFNGDDGKSAPIPSRSDNLLNSGKAKVETVRENVEAANDHGDGSCELDKKFSPSCSRSDPLNTVTKVQLENIRQNATVVLESGNVDSNSSLICSETKAMPSVEHMETDKETLEQRELTMHQPNGVPSGRAESVANTFQSVQELEKSSSEEAVEQCQAIADPIKVPIDLAEQLERVLEYSGGTQEQEKITQEGGGNLRISQESEEIEVGDNIADMEKCAKKFEDLGFSEHLKAPSLETVMLENESQSLAEKNMKDEAEINMTEDGQEGKCSDKDENGMVLKEEILWFESQLQPEVPLEEQMSEIFPEIFRKVGEAVTKVDMVLEPDINGDKLNFKDEEDSQTANGEYDENETAVNAGESEAVEKIGPNNSFEVQSGEIPLVVEISNTNRAAEGREEHESRFEFHNSASENNTSEEFDAHSKDSGTIFNDNHGVNTTTISTEVPETSNVYFDKEAKRYQSHLRRRKGYYRYLQELYEIGENETDLSRFRSLKRLLESRDSKSTYEENENTLPKGEDVLKTATHIHNTTPEHAANTNMSFSPERHVSTSQVEMSDNTNAMPDLQRNSEDNKESQLSSTLEKIDDVSAQEPPASRENAEDTTADKEEVKGILDLNSDEIEHVGQQNDQRHLSRTNCKPEEMDKSEEAETEIKTGQNMEKDMENLDRASTSTSTSEQQDVKGNEQKCDLDDQMQRIEAIKKGREREKDRIAVERAIREARERAFAEARERAERAAVERAAAEARQRVLAEKIGMASIETKQPPADKTAVEAKLRAERAAVERAIAEARERAREKATSQKTSVDAKHSTERLSTSSRNNGLKNSLSSSDLEKTDGASSESALRRKARLERHQRIMERAGMALAEKNMRDLLAQKEQAERSRLAETLDADVKRWAKGKQGNLRALLSTLQYILGPESGWQPVTLTEIVTTAAVKKAYRKATLCVHPDKLQQRGATIQQKYICEKIFDLLKAAWNRFNSEEN